MNELVFHTTCEILDLVRKTNKLPGATRITTFEKGLEADRSLGGIPLKSVVGFLGRVYMLKLLNV